MADGNGRCLPKITRLTMLQTLITASPLTPVPTPCTELTVETPDVDAPVDFLNYSVGKICLRFEQ